MLILSRKVGESIIMNDDIVITVTAIDRGRVQIGIRAPAYVPVYRQEIVERMVAEGQIEPLACLAPRDDAACLAPRDDAACLAPRDDAACLAPRDNAGVPAGA